MTLTEALQTARRETSERAARDYAELVTATVDRGDGPVTAKALKDAESILHRAGKSLEQFDSDVQKTREQGELESVAVREPELRTAHAEAKRKLNDARASRETAIKELDIAVQNVERAAATAFNRWREAKIACDQLLAQHPDSHFAREAERSQHAQRCRERLTNLNAELLRTNTELQPFQRELDEVVARTQKADIKDHAAIDSAARAVAEVTAKRDDLQREIDKLNAALSERGPGRHDPDIDDDVDEDQN